MRHFCSLSFVCTEYLGHRNNTNGLKLEYLIHIINLNKYFYGNTVFPPFLDVTFSYELQVSEPLHLGVLVYNVFLAYSADASWLVTLSSMLFAVI